MGLYSFMMEETPTQGSIVTTKEYRQKLALESMDYNMKNKYVTYMRCAICFSLCINTNIYLHRQFVELFPDVITLYESMRKANAASNSDFVSKTKSKACVKIETEEEIVASWLQVAGLVGILGVVLYFMMQIAILD